MHSTPDTTCISRKSNRASINRLSRQMPPNMSSCSSTPLVQTEDSLPAESLKKRSRLSSDVPRVGQKKSVTVMLKATDTEEFHHPSASTLHYTGNSLRYSTLKSHSLLSEATAKDKVMAVVNLFRNRRRRPDEKTVILYSEKIHQVTPRESKAALQSLVKEGLLFSVKHTRGMYYRQHIGTSRGNTVSQHSNKIRSDKTKTAPQPNALNNVVKIESDSQSSSRNSTKKITEAFTETEINTLKLLLRIVSPVDGDIYSNQLTSSDFGLVKKEGGLHSDELSDTEVLKYRLAMYIFPPPTPISSRTVEEALQSLPHKFLDALSTAKGNSIVTRKNGNPGVRDKLSRNTLSKSSSISKYVQLSIVPDPTMAILMRRRSEEGFTELCIRSPGSSLRNAFTFQVLAELTDALQQAAEDNTIRIVVISGFGRVFSSGVDLPSLLKADPNFVDSLVERLRAFLLKLCAFPKVLVAGVNGPAEGLGTAILPLFDMIYASDTATFHTAYIALGQVPEAGACLTFANRVGVPLANDLLIAGRKLSAREALQRGLLSDLLYPNNFSQQLSLRCAQIASQSAMALETTKCLLRMHDRQRVELVINTECQKLSEIWKTAQFRLLASNYSRHCMDDFL